MDKTTRTTLAALALPAVMIGTDFTGAMALVVLMEKEYGVDISTTQWVLNAYALTFAMVMVAGGRLGDIVGRRRLLFAGLGIFLVSSFACTVAPSMTLLIVARAAQGIGSALAWPSILAMAATAGRDDQRGKTVSLILAAITTGNVLGPIIAGTVAGFGLWRPFFAVNLGLAVASVAVVWWLLPKQPRGSKERVDFAGMAVLSLAVFGLMFALDIGADWGWTSVRTLALLAACIALFAIFVPVEARVRDPMVPPAMLRDRAFMLALATNGFVIPTIFLMFLYVPQYLNKGLGWSPSAASFGTFPMYIASVLTTLATSWLYSTIGARRLLIGGHLLAFAAGVWMVFGLSPSLGYAAIIIPAMAATIGVGVIIPAAGTLAVNAAGGEHAGLAGGLSFMVHLTVGALGVAGATAIMMGLGAGSESVTSTAFAEGLRSAFQVGLILAIGGLVVAWLIEDDRQASPAGTPGKSGG
ncbi:MAG: MFS transporter [Bauldia sp.]|nr:MFS transporter [Bauldia sp.]